MWTRKGRAPVGGGGGGGEGGDQSPLPVTRMMDG
jgi:hypothetical protein